MEIFDLQTTFLIVNFHIKSQFNIYKKVIVQFLDQIIQKINVNITKSIRTMH
jgi:hypothetical protein